MNQLLTKLDFPPKSRCPRCRSLRLRRRPRQPRRARYACQNCNLVFRKPRRSKSFYLLPAAVAAVALIIAIIAMSGGGSPDTPQPAQPQQQPQFVPPEQHVLASRQAQDAAFNRQNPPTPTPPPAQQTSPQLLPPQQTVAPQPTPTVDPNLPPDQINIEQKAYMLHSINEIRTRSGSPPLALGTNPAAQLHADEALKNCYASHWDLNGLKPYMRYSILGGIHQNTEAAYGNSYCITIDDERNPIRSISEEIDKAVTAWTQSPAHNRSITDPHYRFINIGVAWNRYNFLSYYQIERNHIEYMRLPTISSLNVLSMAGRAKNGASFPTYQNLGIQIHFDPPPQQLTVGQLARTYCAFTGAHIASIRPEARAGQAYRQSTFQTQRTPCPNPTDNSPDDLPPTSPEEARQIWQTTVAETTSLTPLKSEGDWITASRWTSDQTGFDIEANLNDLIKKHGKGVYTVVIWAIIDNQAQPISKTSIFHQLPTSDIRSTYETRYQP